MKKMASIFTSKKWFYSSIFLLLSSIFFLSSCSYLPYKSSRAGKAEDKLYRGVYHVHSNFSPDSKATLSQILNAGRQTSLDFVIVTDPNREAASAYQKMRVSVQDPKLFFGAEVTTPDGHLTLLGVPSLPEKGRSSQDIIDWAHEKGGYAFISHPVGMNRPWTNWDIKNFDGLEVYNFAYSLMMHEGISQSTRKFFLSPRSFLKSSLKTPYTELTIWDRHLKERKVIGIAAADASLRKGWFDFIPQNLIMQFQSVTIYAQANELKESLIWEAIGKGRTFMAFEVLGSARGFSFLVREGENVQGPGSEVSFKEGMDFHVKVPAESEIRLIRDSQIVERIRAQEMTHKIQAKGTYRVEVYRKGKLWIFTNPIWIS